MSFAMLPPEINSALIYAGAGVSPLVAAAAAWDGLAAELHASASGFGAVISVLTAGPLSAWSGPAAAAMTAAAAPYVGWMNVAAGHAESAAGQARTAAAIFDTAMAATVHPAAVAANRVALTSLVATNFLGMNTPAIAATEIDYEQMWTQDVAAMAGYRAAAVSVVSALAPLDVPPPDLPGLISQAVSGISSAVQSAVSAVPLDSLSSLAGIATLPVSTLLSPMMSLVQSAGGSGAGSAASLGADVPMLAGTASAATAPVIGGGLGPAIAADMGRGRLVGALSVPPAWAGSAAAPMAPTASATLGVPNSASAAGMAGLGGMPMMPMPIGGASAGAPGGMLGRGGSHVVAQRPSVIPRLGVG